MLSNMVSRFLKWAKPRWFHCEMVQSCACAQAPLKLSYARKKINPMSFGKSLSRAMSFGKSLRPGPTQHYLGRAAQILIFLKIFVIKNMYSTNL